MSEMEQRKAALEAKLAELEMERDSSVGLRDISLDEEDKLRLENTLLREKIVQRDLADAREALHLKLVAKYNVNLAVESISIDASTGTLTVTPR